MRRLTRVTTQGVDVVAVKASEDIPIQQFDMEDYLHGIYEQLKLMNTYLAFIAQEEITLEEIE